MKGLAWNFTAGGGELKSVTEPTQLFLEGLQAQDPLRPDSSPHCTLRDPGQPPELCHSCPPWGLHPGPWGPLVIAGVSVSLLIPQLPPELAYDVLSVADMYLLPGLKRLCGRSLAQMLEEDSVVGVWRIAKLFRLARLEDQCTEYMAKVIEKVGRGAERGGCEGRRQPALGSSRR